MVCWCRFSYLSYKPLAAVLGLAVITRHSVSVCWLLQLCFLVRLAYTTEPLAQQTTPRTKGSSEHSQLWTDRIVEDIRNAQGYKMFYSYRSILVLP